MRHKVRFAGGAVTFLVALFTLPATSSDYPESLKWFSGKIGPLDGDDVKNVLFFVALAAFVGFVFGPQAWRRIRDWYIDQSPVRRGRFRAAVRERDCLRDEKNELEAAISRSRQLGRLWTRLQEARERGRGLYAMRLAKPVPPNYSGHVPLLEFGNWWGEICHELEIAGVHADLPELSGGEHPYAPGVLVARYEAGLEFLDDLLRAEHPIFAQLFKQGNQP